MGEISVTLCLRGETSRFLQRTQVYNILVRLGFGNLAIPKEKRRSKVFSALFPLSPCPLDSAGKRLLYNDRNFSQPIFL